MSNSLQILMPAHNEGKNIKNHITKVNDTLKKKIKFSFLICEDGSSDNTAKEIRENNCILISLEKNMGKGYAMRMGIETANGDYIIFMGGDGQDDPVEIDLLLQEVKNGFDYVIGSRFLNFDSSDNRFSDKAVLPVNEFGNKSITYNQFVIQKKYHRQSI